jgi:enediyne biosynthesis protein E4
VNPRLLLVLLCVVLIGAAAPVTRNSQGWFRDVASLSHFDYRTENDFHDRKYFPQPMCGGVAIVDFDGDGKNDIFFTNGAQIPGLKKSSPKFMSSLLHNHGNGVFEDVTEKAGVGGSGIGYSFGVAAGDYDNDGHEDLFLANAGQNTLYRNLGNGRFADVTAGSGLDNKPPNLLSVGAAWLDYDNDGLLDLVISNYTTWSPESDRRCVTGEATDVYCSPKTYTSVPARLYHNLGNGHFSDVTEASGIGSAAGKGMGISIADFNNDGWADIFIANDTERNFLFMNQGNGTFKEQGLLYGVAYKENGAVVSGMGSDARDYNNDGWPDVVFNDLAGEGYGLFRNHEGRSFDDVSTPSNVELLTSRLSGWSIGFIDFNNDGWKDIFSANGSVDNIGPDAKQHDTMFENQHARFEDVSTEMGRDFLFSGYQRGSGFGDLNNDGFMDLVVTSLGERPRILMNNALNHNHWILLDLRGTKSNRDGIGARVQLTTSTGRTLFNYATTSVGFMSSSDRRVHFGLGTDAGITTMEIRWPSGVAQKIAHPPVDRILRVEEASQP